jgi:hypothetical protein
MEEGARMLPQLLGAAVATAARAAATRNMNLAIV